jgi:uncharacterized membrane protein
MGVIALTILSALAFAIGHALQKHGVSQRLATRAGERTGKVGRHWLIGLPRQPLWLAGMASILLASALDLQAVSLGDLTLVKPLLGMQAAFAVAIGVGLLGERMRRVEAVGVGLLVAGAALVAATAAPGETRVPDHWQSGGIFGASLVVVAAVVAVHVRAPARLRGEAAFGLAAGLLFGVSDFMMKIATSIVVTASGSFSVVSPTSLLALLHTPEVVWIALANLGAFLLMQLAYSKGRVAVISPLASLSGTAFAVVLGFIVLGEPLSILRAAGIAVVLAGTSQLVRAEARVQSTTT